VTAGAPGRGLLAVAVLAAAAVLSCARAPVVAPPAPPPEARVRGTVVLDNGLVVPLEGALVHAGEEAAAVTAAGTFSLGRLVPGKHSVVVEKRFPAGPVRRVMGVALIYVADAPVEVRVRVRDATDVDAFCSDCHPVKGKATRRDQVIRDVHPSGVVPRKARKPGGAYDEKGRVTCESCHTAHRPTEFPHFTLASYRDGRLCLRCH